MDKWISIVLTLSLGVVMLTGCAPAVDSASQQDNEPELVQMKPPADGQEMAVVTTNYGEIKFVLYEEYAPNTVSHFKKLVEDGFYNNNGVWGIQKETNSFMAGATDAAGKEGKIETDDGKPVSPEVNKNVWHFSGAVSAYGKEQGVFNKSIMSDSRFFILGETLANQQILDKLQEYDFPQNVIDAYKVLGGCPQITGNYTVFGQVVSGMDVVDEIVSQQVVMSKDQKSIGKPVDPIVIEHIILDTYSSKILLESNQTAA